MFYWVLKTLILGPILRLLFRPWVEGQENIPTEGAAVFASNHLSFSDSIFLPLGCALSVPIMATGNTGQPAWSAILAKPVRPR